LNQQKIATAWAGVASGRPDTWPPLLEALASADDPALVPDRTHPVWAGLIAAAGLPAPIARAPDRALALLSRIRRGPIADPAIDALLRQTRDALITACIDGALPGGWLLLATSLAEHAELADYLWPEPSGWDALPGDHPGDLLALCVAPLADQPTERRARFEDDESPMSAPLRRRLIEHPEQELRLADELERLTEIAPEHAAIASLYEARPYPRAWRPPPVRPMDLRAYVLARVPRLAEVLPTYTARPRVLAAGCGTGRQPLSLARALPDCEVLGIDLSLASLAHATRRARSAGLDQLRFAQADLTLLHGSDLNYDHVECTGVLHHLAEPAAGWRALAACTRPGGTLRLAVYSERGRQDVVAARALAGSLGLRGHDLSTLRALRVALDALPEAHSARRVLMRVDAYTAPGLADLVLNPSEHRYDPPGLAAALDDAGLEFLGMESNDPHGYAQQLHAWRTRWPEDPRMLDLAHWDTWESEHPDQFRNMYILWARRPAESS
jgi:SAM-dependent methyltransferase